MINTVSRSRLHLNRLLPTLTLAILLAFWWATVYQLLVAGWWLLNGYFTLAPERNPYHWNGLIDWAFMLLALLSMWPMQHWLRPRIALLAESSDDDPYVTISRVLARMDTELTAETLPPAIIHSLAETLNLPYVALASDDGSLAETGPRPITPLVSLSLSYQEQSLGELRLAPRVVAGALLPIDGRLLGDLTRQISLTLYATRLSAELQESRRRIVTAGEEGRRLLRRDLHDGLGPALATMTMQAETARDLLRDDPVAADRLLAELTDQAQATVAEVRRIVHGLRPPALDELGLFGALGVLAEGLATPDLSVTIRLPEQRPPLPAAVEVAVYRIAQEALTNIRRHAGAQSAALALWFENDGLRLEVADDGAGLPQESRPGMGLSTMRERAEEIGGTLSVQQNQPKGTRVTAQFPLEFGETS
ncbi:MAG: sensor histidine kinase [Candidatus Promineofilum sp.]|nr:sensor histidine kinase [Promineifilum sp.]